ncbi:MAG: S9 family peptidase [Bacteroidales bacterium]|nr:S9 family peptidase [Bacteroidales bacterium]HQP04813.1 S9 family peptidase [Bacteroidales bacterium]
MKRTLLLIALCFSILGVFSQTQITLKDIYGAGTFYPNTVDGIVSMNDGEHYTTLNMGRNTISKYSYKTGEMVENLFKAKDFKDVKIPWIFDYQFNHDETMMLISTNYDPIYRHSFKADYYIYDLKEKTLKPLSEEGSQQLACFSPDGSKISFVRNNNIYVVDLATGIEQSITTDGEWNHIINGAPDWVYEEEFSFSKAYEWSPDGNYLAFLKTDESNVKQYSIQLFDGLYPSNYEYKYPKAGEENSKVDVYVYQFKSGLTVKMDIPGREDDYIPRIKWTNTENTLAIVHLNRLQNELTIIFGDALSGNTEDVLTYTEKKYIEINDDLTFLEDGQRFLFSHESDGYRHLYLYSNNGKLINQVTKGNWEMTTLYGCDNNAGKVYYQSCESSPINRSIYSVNLDGSGKKLLSAATGTNEAEFSSSFAYFINTYSDANTPYIVTLNNSEGELIREIENNNALRQDIKDKYCFSEKKFFTFTTSEGVELNGWMIKPANFKASKKYPVLFYVYGGPGIQTVTNDWDYNLAWWQMLAQQGYIVVSVDNRGTGARGKDFRQVTYGQLGKYEVIDQIEAAKYLGAQKYVDKSRIGIFGWSYGGYMTALCMTIGADYFKAGIAVAPVTNWRYYDSVYTERYNGLPQNNASGYDDNSPINHTSELKGSFLLVHGTADDNVHFQNSVELVQKLIDSDKQFETMYYPNLDHSIYGGNARMHLYTKMTNFIYNKL